MKETKCYRQYCPCSKLQMDIKIQHIQHQNIFKIKYQGWVKYLKKLFDTLNYNYLVCNEKNKFYY